MTKTKWPVIAFFYIFFSEKGLTDKGRVTTIKPIKQLGFLGELKRDNIILRHDM